MGIACIAAVYLEVGEMLSIRHILFLYMVCITVGPLEDSARLLLLLPA